MYHCQTATLHTHTHTHTHTPPVHTHRPSFIPVVSASSSFTHQLSCHHSVFQKDSTHSRSESVLHDLTHYCHFISANTNFLFSFHREKTADQTSAVRLQRPAAPEVRNTLQWFLCCRFVLRNESVSLLWISSLRAWKFYLLISNQNSLDISLTVYNNNFLNRFCIF